MQNGKVILLAAGPIQSPLTEHMRKGALLLASFLILFFAFAQILSDISYGAEKKAKKQPSQLAQKDTGITDSNVQMSFKKAEEQLKKGDTESSLKIFVKVYDYTKEALATIRLINNQYEKLINESTINQNEKEDIFIRLKRLKQLIPKYTVLKEKSTYNIGYLYAKKGDSEKASKYLSEVLETTSFSTKQDSLWMKSKTLLLGLYGLEGEF